MKRGISFSSLLYRRTLTECRIISFTFCCNIDLQIESKSKVNYEPNGKVFEENYDTGKNTDRQGSVENNSTDQKQAQSSWLQGDWNCFYSSIDFQKYREAETGSCPARSWDQGWRSRDQDCQRDLFQLRYSGCPS